MNIERKYHKFHEDLDVAVYVEEHAKYFNVLLLVNNNITATQFVMKPEPPLTFGDLEPGARFIKLEDDGEQTSCWGDSVWIKVKKTIDNKDHNVLILKDTRKTLGIDSSAQLTSISDDTLVEEIVDL
jgi:hypothetical protein